MIRTKENVKDILMELKKFNYNKEDEDIDVYLNEEDNIKIVVNSQKYIKIDFCTYDEALSLLYKDRKYINKALFQ